MENNSFYLYLFLGLSAAWAILAAYVVYLATRESSLRRQLDSLKRIVEEREHK